MIQVTTQLQSEQRGGQSFFLPVGDPVEGDSQEEDLEHQEEEPDKDVGIESVLMENCPRGRAYDMRYPSEERVRERLDLFAARTGFRVNVRVYIVSHSDSGVHD